jgi:hypothetical protein
MYNGQYAKGVVHLIIFAVLVSFADHVNGIFGLFVCGWVVFQSIEAYHTARAKRDGLPLPNAFGFNDIGERMGFGKNWVVGHAKVGEAPTQWAAGAPVVPPAVQQTAPPPTSWPPPPPPGVAGNWAGYVPPAAFGGPPPVAPYAAPYASSYSAPPKPAAAHVPYSETYTGVPYDPAVVPPARSSGFPVAAVWLIGLGVVFSLSNWIPFWRISGLWLLALLFAGLAAWMLVRRLGYAGGVHYRGSIACVLRGPVVLATLALIFALQAAQVATIGETWGLLLITFGAVLLVERTVGASNVPIPPPYVPPTYGAPSDSASVDPGKGGL